MNHRIKYFPESPGPLFPSWSKTSRWPKLGPEQNSSPGHDAALLRFEMLTLRMLTLRMGPSLPYLQKQPWQLLRLAAGRNACKKGSSIAWKKTRSMRSAFVQNRVLLLAAGGWVREGGLRKGFVLKLFWCRHIDFIEEEKGERGGVLGSCLACPRCRWELAATSPCSTPGVPMLPCLLPEGPRCRWECN